MLKADVGGRAELRHTQGRLRAAGTELDARLLKQTRDAMRPLKPAIVASAARLPSGYAPIMAKAVRVETDVRSAAGGVRAKVKVSAQGRKANRDVRSVNAGRLKHPLFGRRVSKAGKSLWFDTSVKPRFVSDPVDDLARRIGNGAEEAANDVADSIVEG